MSRDIPIIFSGAMVRALLDGRKTMTRRLALTSKVISREIKPRSFRSTTKILRSTWQKVAPGDRLWVRENFAYVGASDPGFLTYGATYPDDLLSQGVENVPPTLKEAGYKWTPCIHMPRRVSRLTLVITGIKVERLQDISEADAKAEGWTRCPDVSVDPDVHRDAARDWFSELWQSLHGVESWRSNPEVVAISFEVIKQNIDRIPA